LKATPFFASVGAVSLGLTEMNDLGCKARNLSGKHFNVEAGIEFRSG
jgi:hypothetical protein